VPKDPGEPQGPGGHVTQPLGAGYRDDRLDDVSHDDVGAGSARSSPGSDMALPAGRAVGVQPRGHTVEVEVIYLRLPGIQPGGAPGRPHAGSSSGDDATDLERAGRLAYRIRAAVLPHGLAPDALARRLSWGEAVDGPRAPGPGDLVHSTSWRFAPGTGIVLTYVVLPDPEPGAPARPLREPAVVCSGDPHRPAPPVLHEHHVVAHAVHHLAELAVRDPAIRAAAAQPATADLWSAIAAVARRIPTGTHAAAHQQAHADDGQTL
jgi:hypothetical protein